MMNPILFFLKNHHVHRSILCLEIFEFPRWCGLQTWWPSVTVGGNQRLAFAELFPRPNACYLLGNVSRFVCKYFGILASQHERWRGWILFFAFTANFNWPQINVPGTAVSLNLFRFVFRFLSKQRFADRLISLYRNRILSIPLLESQVESQLQDLHAFKHWPAQGFRVSGTWVCLQGSIHENCVAFLCCQKLGSGRRVSRWVFFWNISTLFLLWGWRCVFQTGDFFKHAMCLCLFQLPRMNCFVLLQYVFGTFTLHYGRWIILS